MSASIQDIQAAADYVTSQPHRDCHINGGGRYLFALWSWDDDECRAMGPDAVREIRSVAGVTLPQPLSVRLADAPAVAAAFAERGIRFNDTGRWADGYLRELFPSVQRNES